MSRLELCFIGPGEVNLEQRKPLSLLGFTAIVSEIVLKVTSAFSHTNKEDNILCSPPAPPYVIDVKICFKKPGMMLKKNVISIILKLQQLVKDKKAFL